MSLMFDVEAREQERAAKGAGNMGGKEEGKMGRKEEGKGKGEGGMPPGNMKSLWNALAPDIPYNTFMNLSSFLDFFVCC